MQPSKVTGIPLSEEYKKHLRAEVEKYADLGALGL